MVIPLVVIGWPRGIMTITMLRTMAGMAVVCTRAASATAACIAITGISTSIAIGMPFAQSSLYRHHYRLVELVTKIIQWK